MMQMRWLAGAILALGMTMTARAATETHVRGDLKFQTGESPAFVTPREIPGRWDPAAPGADDRRWRYWLYDVQSDRRAGRDIVHVDMVFEPKSQALLGEAGRFQIRFNPEFQSMAIHRVELLRDGRWLGRLDPARISLARREAEFENDLTDGSVTALIVLDDVRVDDIVRISYSVTGSNPILAGQTSDQINLSWRSPMLRSGLRVLYDPGRRFRVHREHTTVEPRVRRTAEAVEVEMQARDLPPILVEDSYPAWYQPYPMVQIAQERSWAEVVAWALPLYPRFDGAFDADLERRIAEWKALSDPGARLTAVLRAVQNDVRYFGVEIGDNTHQPNAPDLVWRRRYGDCKDKVYLLVTLLRRLDIAAEPALVDTDRGRAIGEFAPAASVFNHVIARVRIGNEIVWVDPTLSQQGGDPRDADLSDYGMGLPVVAGVEALQPIAPPKRATAGVDVRERFVPSADGREVAFEVETIYTGASADYQRRNTLSQRGDELARRYTEHYRKRYSAVEALGEPDIVDDLAANRLRILERYRLTAPFESEAGGTRGLEIYAEALQSVSTLPSSLDRRAPLGFASPGRYRHEIVMQVPDAWKPTFVAEQIERDSGAFGYTRKVEIEKTSVRLVYEMDVKQRELALADVPAHLGDLRKVRDELSGKLRFTIPASLDARQREERLRNLLRDVMTSGEKR
ncbi:MAG TPA: DUF3857 domain-containing protein [Xanthomonadaceae bacterium]